MERYLYDEVNSTSEQAKWKEFYDEIKRIHGN